MKCKFCDQKLESKIFRDKEYFVCKNHKPSKIGYNPERVTWHVTYDKYRLSYYDGETFFRKMNIGSSSAKDFYTLIKKFDHELNIKPEDFNKKLPTLLTFL